MLFIFGMSAGLPLHSPQGEAQAACVCNKSAETPCMPPRCLLVSLAIFRQEDCSYRICRLLESRLMFPISLLVPLQVVFPAITPGATALAAHKWLMDAQRKVEEGGAGCLLQTVVFLLMQPAVRCSLRGLTLHQPDSGSVNCCCDLKVLVQPVLRCFAGLLG